MGKKSCFFTRFALELGGVKFLNIVLFLRINIYLYFTFSTFFQHPLLRVYSQPG